MTVYYNVKCICILAVSDEESEFIFTFPQKSSENIFKMATIGEKDYGPI